jgi:myosin heavy subunit
MKELTEKRKLEILRLFLAGCSYDQIVTESNVAKGTVVNVVNDLRAGRFPAFSDIGDLVDGLRDLSVELMRKRIGVSEAALGLAFFSRLDEMGVTPEKVWQWANMCREMSPPEAPLQEFTAAALELFKTTQETGQSYDSIVANCSQLRTESKNLGEEVEGLKSAKTELELTQAALAEDVQSLTEKKRVLEKETTSLSAKHEALTKETTALEARCHDLKAEIGEMETKSSVLSPVVERLNLLGFSHNELEILRASLEELASSEKLSPRDLRKRFFEELSAYEATLTFEKRKRKLQGEVSTLEAQVESLQKVTARLGLPLREVEEGIRSLASLKKRGITPSMIASFYRVLSQAGTELDELQGNVLELGGLKKAITSHGETVTRLKEEEAQRAKVVDALRSEEAGITATIQKLTEWGQGVIEQAQQKALAAVEEATQGMAKEVREWGDARGELGEYLDDLERARYFTRLPLSSEALENYIQDISPLVVSQGLQITLLWCLRKFNPKSRPPRWVVRKYYSIGEYSDVELADLVRWSLGAFSEEVGDNEGRA